MSAGKVVLLPLGVGVPQVGRGLGLQAGLETLGGGEGGMVGATVTLLQWRGEGSEGPHPTVAEHPQGRAVQVRRGKLGVEVKQRGWEVSAVEASGHGPLPVVHGGEGVGASAEGEVRVLLHGHGHSEGAWRLAGDAGVTASFGCGGQDHEGGGCQGVGQVRGAIHFEGGPMEVHLDAQGPAPWAG